MASKRGPKPIQVVVDWAAIESLPLDLAYRHYVAAMSRAYRDSKRTSGLIEERLIVLLERLGWGETPPITLKAAAIRLGLTRERLRQIELQVRRLSREHPLRPSSLLSALDLLAHEAPIDERLASRKLCEAGLSTIPFLPRNVLAFSELLGHATELRVDRRMGCVVLGPPQSVVRKLVRRLRVGTPMDVLAEAHRQGLPLTDAEIREALYADPYVTFVEGDWFRVLRRTALGLDRLVLLMLAAASPLDVETLHGGVERAMRYGPQPIPPVSVLAAYVQSHPDLVVTEDGVVLREPAPHLLGKVELMLLEILRDGRILSRRELSQEFLARGIGRSRFTQVLQVHPILMHPGPNKWMLRRKPPPEKLPAAGVARTRARGKRPTAP